MSKKKIFIIADNPLFQTGVGIQTRNMIEGLLKTGNYSFVCLGGGNNHRSHEPFSIEGWGDDWVIYPVEGFGTPENVRFILRSHKPDMMWFMTDPHYFEWLWAIEHEIRVHVPMVYYHVWDNLPYPKFNKVFYDSTDAIVSISKLTEDVVRTVSNESVLKYHLPHAVDLEVFKPDENIKEFRRGYLGEESEKKMIFFWNNKNMKRKHLANQIFWFKDFMEEVGDDSVNLILKTDPHCRYGTDVETVLVDLGLDQGQIKIIHQDLDSEKMARLYQMSDCVINIADAEGFGLSSTEALATGTPLLSVLTGGLQDQINYSKTLLGEGIKPSSSYVIGNQKVPYIMEDRITKQEFIGAAMRLYKKWKKKPEEYKRLKELCRKSAEERYDLKKYVKQWDEILTDVHEKCGSWETRRNYKHWELREI